MTKILVVDDDAEITKLLEKYLGQEGYQVAVALDGATALSTASSMEPDLVILDIVLGNEDGRELLGEMRLISDVPIIFLTGRGLETERIAGLKLGADDYIVKPFSMTELAARIRAVLRRIRPGLAEDRIRHGDLVIDRAAHRVRRGAREVRLGPTEFRLLDYLMQHPGRVFSREQLLDAVWGSDVYVEARTVDVHIGRLRKALNQGLEDDPIRTVRSAGYSLDVEAA